MEARDRVCVSPSSNDHTTSCVSRFTFALGIVFLLRMGRATRAVVHARSLPCAPGVATIFTNLCNSPRVAFVQHGAPRQAWPTTSRPLGGTQAPFHVAEFPGRASTRLPPIAKGGGG